MFCTTYLARYGVACLAVAAAYVAKLGMDSLVDSTSPFVPFAAAVLAAVWYGGRGPGLLATILGAVVGSYYFIPPHEHLLKPTPSQNLRMVGFVLFGFLLVRLINHLRLVTRQARQQQDELRLLVESTRDYAAFLLDAGGRVASWNAGAERVLGYPEAEVLGVPFARLCASADGGTPPPPFLPGPAEAQAAGGGWHVRRDGSQFRGEWVVTGLPGGDGRPREFVAVVHDITERKEAEEALARSDRRLSLVLEATSEGVWDWNVRTGEVYFSPRWIESLGYSPDEVPPHVSFWESIVHPDDLARTRAAVTDHFEGRTAVYECENRLRTKAGAWRWNLDRGKVVEWGADGKPLRMVGTDSDISERKRAEEVLRASEALNRAVLGSLSARVAIVDREGVIVAVNESWDRSAREAGAEPPTGVLTGAKYLDVCRRAAREADESARRALDGIEAVLAGREERFGLEYPCPTPTMEQWFEMVVEPLQRPEGGAVISHTDITARKRVELALRASEARFRRLAEADIVGVWYGDTAGSIHYANGEFLRIVGRTAKEVREGRVTLPDLSPPENHAAHAAKLAEVRERGACTPSETSFLRPDGGRVPVLTGCALVEPGIDEYVAIAVDLTERKRAEEETRTGRRQLQLMADALPVLISYVDRDVRYRFNNAAYEEWFGVSREAIRGKHLREVLGEEAYEILHGHVEAVLAGRPQTFETRLPYQGAGTRDVHVDYVPHRDDRDEVVGFYALIADVSERRRAEEAVRASEEKFRRIVETANEGIWLLDADGRVTFVNGRMAEMLGYSPEEMLGRHKWDFLFEEDRPLGRELFERRRAGISEQCDVRFRHRNDHAVWTLMAARPVTDPDGRFLGVLDMLTDLTARKRTEEALHRSEARLSAIVRSAADAIITTDPRGTIETVNPAAERMFGHRAGELVGRNISLLMPPPYRESHDGYHAHYRRTWLGKFIGQGVELRGLRADGSEFPVELTVSSVDQLGLLTAILRDATDRKELEREVLEAAAAEQRRIGQELHDTVGQDLTGLGLLAAALAKRTADRDPANAATAARIAEELGRTHQHVRALSRGLVPVEVDPEGLRAALEELAARTTERSGADCRFQWEGPVEVHDTGTATHLLRIAQEAVSNALRHGQPGHVRIALRADPDRLTLEVEDDGTGMPEGPGGAGGLGIRLMQYRAGIIGGSLAVEPAAGGGTLVRCVLPRGERHVVE